MTYKTTPTSPLKRTQSLIRACLLGLLFFPGSGLALLAVACGDVELSDTTDSTPKEDIIRVEAIQPPSPPESEPSPLHLSPEPRETPQPSPGIVPFAHGDPLELERVEVKPQVPPEERAPSMRIVEATLARGVSLRRPIGPTHRFNEGEVVWAWAAVSNASHTQPLTMLWYRHDQLRSRLTLDVGESPRWRTWSRRTMRKGDVGVWRVELRSDAGDLLHTMRFEVRSTREDLSALAPEFDGC